MTIREWLAKYLTDNGLWPQEAEAILVNIENDAAKYDGDHAKKMVEVFHKVTEGYPPQLFAVMAISINHDAVEWIDVNKPQHWARPMFLPTAEREALPGV